MRVTVPGHQVSTVSLGMGTHVEAYQCVCSCGYEGPVRRVAAATGDDVERHITRSAY